MKTLYKWGKCSYSAAFTGGKVGFRTSKGQAHFDNLLFTNSQTERSLYALGNQTIATRVSGDPAGTNNGLFYIFSDHLGSTSVLATSTGNQVPGSRATYYPFGSPRTAPTQTITGRNFTGQKENLELGLIYFNARYYLPNLARFLTPDILVPDPQNPQAYNRYTYTLNNPLRFTDPSGHCAYDSNPNIDDPYAGDAQCWSLLWELERIWDIDIQDEALWDYLYLDSLKYIFEQYAEFVGGEKVWMGILKASAAISGRDKFIVKGDMGDWDDAGRCATGCNNSGEVRFNLPVAFSIHNPAAGRYGEFYSTSAINQGRLTMAHEFAHIMFGVTDDFLLTSYQTARAWMQDPSTGSWSDQSGNLLDYENPSHFFIHVVALYVSAGNSWSEIAPVYFVDQSITIHEQAWISYTRLDFFLLYGR